MVQICWRVLVILWIAIVEKSSKDGINFNTERTVADKSQNSDLGSCKLESVQMKYVESKNIMMIWAHWEQPSGYSSGKALVITGTPGGNFTVHHIYNPLGIYVRDMSIFLDDDDTAYLVAASNESGQGANATMYIFKMNDTYSDVTQVVKKLHENQYREFPCLIKRDGYYYLFTSQTAGWYPSKGGYTVTKSLDGTWSDLRSIGDSSTFSSQSGWIQSIGDGTNCVMHAYRWLRSSDTAGSTLCPIYFANGFAFYDYCTSFKYNMKNSTLLPIQDGEWISLNKPVTSSISSSSVKGAVDGSYDNAFVGEKKWPFSVQIDLLKECNLSDIQISWYMCKGSEGYYTYYVEGSTDGTNWTKLLDRTNESDERVTKNYGFTNDGLSGTARYVRLTVTNAHLHNNPNNNWYTPKIYEIKVFGNPINDSTGQTKTENQPIAAYHLDKSEISNGKISDKTGRNSELEIYGNYGTDSKEDAIGNSESSDSKYIGKSTQPVYFSGSDGCYAKLPDGLLNNKNEFSISIRARSDMDFSKPYFTLGIGNSDKQYFLFKLGKDNVRLNITNNSWMGETGIKKQVDGSNWHTYTITVDETTAKLYVDKQLIAENYTMGALLSNFGDNAKLYLGKSFYGSDQYFNGSISSICFYDYALPEDKIAQMKNTVYFAEPHSDTKDISDCTITLSGTSFMYTGSAVKPKVTIKDGSVTLNLGTDYIIRYEDNVDIGTAAVIIAGKGSYTGRVEKTFNIIKDSSSIANCTISLSKSSFTYTGSAVKPKVTIKNGSQTLNSGTDYVVRYVNNVNIGTATIVIAGRGNYTGSTKKTFQIILNTTTPITMCEISLNKQILSYTGKAVKPKVTVKNGATVLNSGTDYVIRYLNNVDRGTGTVVISGKGSYSGTTKVYFTIK